MPKHKKRCVRLKEIVATVAVFFYPFSHHVTKTQMWDIQTDQSENYTSLIVLKVWQFIDRQSTEILAYRPWSLYISPAVSLGSPNGPGWKNTVKHMSLLISNVLDYFQSYSSEKYHLFEYNLECHWFQQFIHL